MAKDLTAALLLVLVSQGSESPWVKLACALGVILCAAIMAVKLYTKHLRKKNKAEGGGQWNPER